MDDPGKLNEDKASLNAYSRYSSIVVQMIAIIGVLAFIGYKLDAWLKHDTPWVTALLCVAGVCLSIFQTIRQLKE